MDEQKKILEKQGKIDYNEKSNDFGRNKAEIGKEGHKYWTKNAVLWSLSTGYIPVFGSEAKRTAVLNPISDK